MGDNSDNTYCCISTNIAVYRKGNFKYNQIVMKNKNIMGLDEAQEYISSERHEWNVPSELKDKVAKMVGRYNKRAEKKGYESSVLKFDETTLKLSGLFTPKAESKSYFGKLIESGNNADLCGDIKEILVLCKKICPQCGNLIPALSKVCEVCGNNLLEKGVNLQDKDIIPQESTLKENVVEEITQHLKYALFDNPITVQIPNGVTYYDTVLSFFKDFKATQIKNPKNHVNMGFTLDLDKIELADDEMIDEDDVRLRVSAFNVANEVFSIYNDFNPLFEENVKNGKPQIFILLRDNYVDVNRCAAFAEEHKISFAQEFGIDQMTKKHYESLVLSFGDDAEAAAHFLCYVSDNMLHIPKDTPVDAFILSDKSKSKAQKEFKKMYSFSVSVIAKGAMQLLKDGMKGK